MKIQWWLPSAVSVFCVISPSVVAPALATGVTSWRFDPGQNQLEFRTREPVQPRAQLVTNPTRLVIDLPDIEMEQAPIDRDFSGNIRQIRIEQFDGQTTRIVLELAPGYTIDPQQIRFRGLSPTQWTVQLPQPMPESVAVSREAPPAASVTNPIANPVANPPDAMQSTPSVEGIDPTLAQIAGIQATSDGLFVRFRSGVPQVEVERSRDRRSVVLTVENAVLSPELTQQEVSIDRFGVERVQFEQVSDRSSNRRPTVRIRLEVDPSSQDWQATVSNLGGIVMLPTGNSSTARTARNPSASDRTTSRQANRSSVGGTAERISAERANSERANAAQNSSGRSIAAQPNPTPLTAQGTRVSASNGTVTIEGVELNPVNNQLLIESDRPVAPTTRWQDGTYQIVLSPARLAERITGPRLTANSPLIRVRLRQEDADTVVISLQPATGVRFGSLNLVSPQLLSLEMERSPLQGTPARSAASPSAAALSGNPPSFRSLPPQSNSIQPLPRPGNGRLVVAIDPGHGGVDVGAVGIGNIREADIVLNVSQQVARLLEQQGIQAVMTRSDDREIDLQPRVDIAEQVNAALFVSIHANSISMDRPEVNGVETYYYSSGAGLADTIHHSIMSDLGMNDRGVRQARFYVLRRTSMPAVLVEIGFVTGSQDAPRLANPNWQNQMATAIARGILQYLRTAASR
ncbi:N-acetylmuramoyl-L-alanine amidase [Leptolyngbya sp. FACHB-711]|uniref:N-acetylmuramoyl-L-alanine amidase n=1 Tax=unclassified Leptolyngbya TaxID=2650499 RepID=UPI0016898DED|nr:N-acetylmuramoyl-L-alanine amidase [Leptolyngbya sp. FACHB-711]MBD1849207.1 N-acetylmuramoyl-L-alanine amidase [Cyanobacteria bacterium FACHB-502]MBD2025135.1 N-acetylmuramoyl-L-alanine amidase [Leptolyngbya sp. FACHB-711]